MTIPVAAAERDAEVARIAELLIEDERGGGWLGVAGRLYDAGLRSTSRDSEVREAIEAVESRHRQGDYTEDGWVGNSIDGSECSGCGEGWPSTATRLRLAILDRSSEAAPTPDEVSVKELPDNACGVMRLCERPIGHEGPHQTSVDRALASEASQYR